MTRPAVLFGFMIAANRYVNAHNDMYALSDRQADFQQNKAFNGVELVHETHRLALMNAYLHNMNANITLGIPRTKRQGIERF